MGTKGSLTAFLRSVNGAPFHKYKGMEASYDLDGITLYIDKVQSDPRSQSEMRVRISFKRSGFPDDTHDTQIKEIALRDIILRRFWESCRTVAKGGAGGGLLSIPRPGQEIMERSCVVMSPSFIEVRFGASLPFSGKSADGERALKMLTEDIPEIAKASLLFTSYKQSKLYNHINTLITARTIRDSLKERGLVAFVADGSVLPRREDGRAPMIGAVPFVSPERLRVTFGTADGGEIKGMGIPAGLTAIIGATGHGRSTLLSALSSGVYDHIPGDGRELVITSGDAAEIVRDEGRIVRNADLSLFMSTENSRSASSDNAGGALSSAAAAAEALEIGCTVLLLDDMRADHSMIYRDRETASLIPEGDETMMPVFESLRGSGISVIAACRHMPPSPDTVIIMSKFCAIDAVIGERPPCRNIRMPADRLPILRNTASGRKENDRVTALSASKIDIGGSVIRIPLPAADICQMNAVADTFADAKELMDGAMTVKDIVLRIADGQRKRISSADVNIGPERAVFRPYDMATVIGRHPDIVFAQKSMQKD